VAAILRSLPVYTIMRRDVTPTWASR